LFKGKLVHDSKWLAVARLILASIWLYHGLWNKLISPAAHHVAVVEQIGSLGPLTPRMFLTMIGLGETLLGLGTASGWLFRFVALFQIVLVVTMNAIGIMFASKAIADPVALVFQNLPFLACAALVAAHGPGAWVWPTLGQKRLGKRP
jgi:uncharacterized membrane protein YphA (DoxX/SURF4 family)